MTLTSLLDNGIVTIFLLLLIFAGIALLANWIRKLIWPQSNDASPIDPKKAVKEELDRILVPLEKPLESPTTTNFKKISAVKTINQQPKKSSTNSIKKKKLSASNAGKRTKKSS